MPVKLTCRARHWLRNGDHIRNHVTILLLMTQILINDSKAYAVIQLETTALCVCVCVCVCVWGVRVGWQGSLASPKAS